MRQRIATVLAVTGLLAGCTQNVEKASQEFNQLPAAVQTTVRGKAPNAEIADIEKQARNGREVYVIQFRDKERYPAMEVAADGMLVKYEAGTAQIGAPGSVKGEIKARAASEAESEYSALPLAVQKVVQANAPKAEVVEIRRTEENGKVVYDVEYAGKDRKPVLRVGADGHVYKKPDEPDPTVRKD